MFSKINIATKDNFKNICELASSHFTNTNFLARIFASITGEYCHINIPGIHQCPVKNNIYCSVSGCKFCDYL